MNYPHEHTMVLKLSHRLRQLVDKNFGKVIKTSKKTLDRDISSSLDTALEALILKSISQTFPKDTVISEESSPDFKVGVSRVWLLDPICGSHNLARGIPLFVTNIALIEQGKVVAAWVIDYIGNRVVWSQGGGVVYSNAKKFKKLGPTSGARLINFDCGHFWELPDVFQERYANVLKDLFLNKDVEISAYNSSVGFLYVVTGQIHGALTFNVRPWDALAGCFLIEQNGGVVTNFDNTSWNLDSRNFIMAGDQAIQAILSQLILKHKLEGVR